LVLKSFAKEKIHGQDGWTVEFFLSYFDLIGNDILEEVEESRRSRSMGRSLNASFLVLIPKVDKPFSFGDFRPITLYNLAYKIITKTIENILKPFLSKALSVEQLGFLNGRHILDVI